MGPPRRLVWTPVYLEYNMALEMGNTYVQFLADLEAVTL